jgi:hypothetical protein
VDKTPIYVGARPAIRRHFFDRHHIKTHRAFLYVAFGQKTASGSRCRLLPVQVTLSSGGAA